MKAFNLTVSTPYKKMFKGEAQSIQCADSTGEFTVLRDFNNSIFATIPSRIVIVDADGDNKEWFASGGILEVRNGEAMLCVDTLETREEIDLARAQASEQKHSSKNKEGDYSEVDDMLNQLSLTRAIGRIQYAKNKK